MISSFLFKFALSLGIVLILFMSYDLLVHDGIDKPSGFFKVMFGMIILLVALSFAGSAIFMIWGL